MAKVRLIVQFTCSSVEQADEHLAGMIERCKASAQEPGCLQFEVFQSALRPQHLGLLELWESAEALEAHRVRGLANPRKLPEGIKRVREDYVYVE